MKISDICTNDIVFVDHEQCLQHAAQLMRDAHVGALVVTGPTEEGTGVMGIVTDRDIAIEGVAQCVDLQRVGIGRIATPGIVTISPDAGIGAAIDLMKERGVRRLLVASDNGRVAGILTLDDVVAALGHEMAGLAAALRKGIDREAAERKPTAAPAQDVRVPLSRYV